MKKLRVTRNMEKHLNGYGEQTAMITRTAIILCVLGRMALPVSTTEEDVTTSTPHHHHLRHDSAYRNKSRSHLASIGSHENEDIHMT